LIVPPSSDEHVRHWCQRCHYRHDAPLRAGMKAGAREARAVGDLFAREETA
jgi:hypothetical protein